MAALLLALPLPRAMAEEPRNQPITIELQQFQVTKDQNGVEQFVAPVEVGPGDILEYRATYTNTGKSSVAGLAAELPIPTGTEYLPRTAAPTGVAVEAKTQKEAYAREPLVRTITEADGTVRKVPVPYAEYRSLRWLLGELKAGGKTTVSARVQVAPVVNKVEEPRVEAAAPAARDRLAAAAQ